MPCQPVHSPLHAKTLPSHGPYKSKFLTPFQMFTHKTSYYQRSIHFGENQQSPCLICNAQQYSVRRSSSVPCSGTVSFTVYQNKSWFCTLCKGAALGLDAFVKNEMYYSNQITFHPKNTHFRFENNKAPWVFFRLQWSLWSEYHCQHSLTNNYYYDLFVILPEQPQNSSCIGTACCIN